MGKEINVAYGYGEKNMCVVTRVTIGDGSSWRSSHVKVDAGKKIHY